MEGHRCQTKKRIAESDETATAALTRKAVVMTISQLVVNEYGNGVVFLLQALLHAGGFGLGNFQAWPSIPLELCTLSQAAQTSDETARGHGEGVLAVIGALDGDGQTVGDEQQAAGAGWFDDTGHCGGCVCGGGCGGG